MTFVQTVFKSFGELSATLTKLPVHKVISQSGYLRPDSFFLSHFPPFPCSSTHTHTHGAVTIFVSVTKPACSSISCLSPSHIPDISTSREPPISLFLRALFLCIFSFSSHCFYICLLPLSLSSLTLPSFPEYITYANLSDDSTLFAIWSLAAAYVKQSKFI